jgi:histidyl-tRNA synthetase
VTAGLDAAGVAWERNARLVRGLDYYRHTAFEFITDRLGAQGTVLGGGRYDGLIENLGGPSTPAVGWAAGIERLAMLIDAPQTTGPSVTVIPEQPELEDEAVRIASHLRRAGKRVSIAYRGNVKRRIELAKKAGSEAILFIKDGDRNRDSLNLTHISKDSSKATELLLNYLLALPTEYSEMSGHDDPDAEELLNRHR